MLQRRPTATLVAVLLPLGAALTSCGFDYPTDRVNTIAAGVNNREADVDVLGARVLASADGHGRLIGTLVYNDNDNDADAPATLTGIEGEGDTVQVDGKLPRIEVAPNKGINLASDSVEPILLTGDFTAGDFVSLTYAFSTTEVVTLEVPVVKACGQYADIEVPGGEAAAEEGEESHAAEETDAEAHDEGTDATYLCDHATEAPEEEGGH
ncbi:hypothetical protein D0Z08_29100 [Nocardioides immobilis]|uniref:Copper chaperone PCu(A)C n=1 Tax=Nocardioides immobilis TaxID=2049295 RepID=A0A417XTF0_9ACTN|nr:hypothetical protein [Nocardioides immobilis]RHW23575.1 hypothetical protein D0Z08_29100 [Nocardioides immobilis]